MEEPVVKKRVDESWKEQAEREKQAPATGSTAPTAAANAGLAASRIETPTGEPGLPEARFDLFISGLAMEALIALGDMAHPVTRKTSLNLTQAKYLIDVMGILQEKTKGNLSVEEEHLVSDALYQLRMRYLAKSGAPA